MSGSRVPVQPTVGFSARQRGSRGSQRRLSDLRLRIFVSAHKCYLHLVVQCMYYVSEDSLFERKLTWTVQSASTTSRSIRPPPSSTELTFSRLRRFSWARPG